jgi:hypothetical protein
MNSNSDGSRLLLRFDKMMRQINREHINEAIHGIGIDDLQQVAEVVAQSRAAYLNCMYRIAKKTEAKQAPAAEELEKLKQLRVVYDELLAASGAFEVAIKRGYLDIHDKR